MGVSQDLRWSLRLLAKNPILNAVAIGSLALGIGATTAASSLIDSLLLRPVRAVHAPEGLVRIFDVPASEPDQLRPLSWASYLDYASHREVVAGLAAMAPCELSLTLGGPAERVSGLAVSASYFSVLGLEPALGRFFSADEEEEGIAVLGHDLWRRRFGADPDVIGKTVGLNGKSLIIVGIAPEGFWGTDLSSRREIWLPLGAYSEIAAGLLAPFSGKHDREQEWLDVIGRLADGVSRERTQSTFDVVARNLAAAYPEVKGRGISVLPLVEVALGPGKRPVVRAFTARLTTVMFLVLTVAVVNLAGLLVARTLARRQEIGIRMSLGASRWCLVRQFLIEGLVIGLMGALAGIVLAVLGLPLVRHLRLPVEVAVYDVTVSGRVLAFALLVSLVSSLVFALAPAFLAFRSGAAMAVSRGMLSGRRSGGGPQEALVVIQVALAFLILLASGLMIRSTIRLAAIDPGFDPKDVLVASVDLAPAGYEGAQTATFYRRLLERLRSLSSVDDATMASALPVMGGNVMVDLPVTVEGRKVPAATENAEKTTVRHVLVGDHYFRTTGTRLLRGRDFGAGDQETAPGAVIVNETLARRLWPGLDPLGRRLRLVQCDEPFEVVGLVADTTYASLRESDIPVLYLFHSQAGKSFVGQLLAPEMTLLVRSKVEHGTILGALREVVRELDPRLPVFGVSTLEALLAATAGVERQAAFLYSFLAFVVVGLAMLGLYGALARGVAMRNREFGIRVACGAMPQSLLQLVLRYTSFLALSGAAVGMAAAVPVSRAMARELFDVAPHDPLTWLIAGSTLLAASLLVGTVPACKAAKTDAVAALRAE